MTRAEARGVLRCAPAQAVAAGLAPPVVELVADLVAAILELTKTPRERRVEEGAADLVRASKDWSGPGQGSAGARGAGRAPEWWEDLLPPADAPTFSWKEAAGRDVASAF